MASIRQYPSGRKAGHYFLDYTIPDKDRPGRRKRRRVPLKTTDRHEAEAIAARYQAETMQAEIRDAEEALAQSHGPRLDPDPTLEQLARWYVDEMQPSRRTKDITRHHIRRYLRRFCDFMHGRHIIRASHLDREPSHIDAWTIELQNQFHLSVSTINSHQAAVSAMFRAAVQRRILYRRPLEPWPYLPEEPIDPGEPIAPETIRQFVDRLHKRHSSYADVILFIVYTGCRPSDACGLNWDDIHDLDTSQPIAHFRQFKTRRFVAVALSPPAADTIRRQPKRQSMDGHVFLTTAGIPFHPPNVTQTIRRHSEAMGVHFTARSFRQAVVSYLADAGCDEAMIRRITGHDSQSIRHYRRTRNAAAHAAARQYADIIGTPDSCAIADPKAPPRHLPT